jgi:hypothetical protein
MLAARDVAVQAAPIPGPGRACAGFPGPRGIWIGCAGGDRITLIDQGSLQPATSLRVDSGGYIPAIVPGRKVVWVLTPSGLARADPATGQITAIIGTGYAHRAVSAPAPVMDSAGRLWVTGSQLAVVVPGTLTAHRVAPAPDLIAAADGPGIWADTGSTRVRLQADTPQVTGAAATGGRREATACRAPGEGHDHDAAPARQPAAPRNPEHEGGGRERPEPAILCRSAAANAPETRSAYSAIRSLTLLSKGNAASRFLVYGPHARSASFCMQAGSWASSTASG